jgi:hypothetical protein
LRSPAAAWKLEANHERTLTLPSEAAAIATPGGFVRIDPGLYADWPYGARPAW